MQFAESLIVGVEKQKTSKTIPDSRLLVKPLLWTMKKAVWYLIVCCRMWIGLLLIGIGPFCHASSEVEQARPTSWLFVSPRVEASQQTSHPLPQKPFASLDTAKRNPLPSIREALDRVQPGCAIIVRGGTSEEPVLYEEQVLIGTAHSGEEGAPVWLVSETFRGAKIKGPRFGQEASAVLFRDVQYFQFHNFQVENRPDEPGDNAPIKLLNTPAPRMKPNRVLIAGNQVMGKGCDGIKVGTSREVEVYGNRIEGSMGFTESAIDGVGSFFNKFKWNTVRGYWKEGPAFKGGSMGVVFHSNDVQILGKPADNAVALLIGELGFSNRKRPMPFEGLHWKWAEAQDFDVQNNRLVTDFVHALWFRGSTHATVVGNYFECASPDSFAKMLRARSGLWRDQPDQAPEPYAEFVQILGNEIPSERVIIYHNRYHTIAGNWVGLHVGREVIFEQHQDRFHRVEAAKPAADFAAVLSGTIGEAGWDAQAIYRILGVVPEQEVRDTFPM
jgi:hypothetical protein